MRNYVSPKNNTANGRVVLDTLNINIIKELVNNPDVKSSVIATKYKTPLSTVQRRKAMLERSLLKKDYHIDTRELGWRNADVFVAVGKGDSEETAKKLLQDFSNVVISTSLRIGDPNVNVVAQIFYKDSEELHCLVEHIKNMPNVNAVEWSEIVKIVGYNKAKMLDKVFG